MVPPVRLPILALAAAVGVIAAGLVAGPWWSWGLLGVAIVVGARRAAWRTTALVGCALAALAARDLAPVAAPAGTTPDDRAVDTIEGWVSGPLLASPGGVGFVVDADGVAVWVMASDPRGVWPGDRVRVVGRLETPRGRRNPGSPDRAQLVRDRGARWELRARSIVVVRADDRVSLWRGSAQVAARASQTIAGRGGDLVGNALVRAAVVGDRSAVPPATDEAWRAAGVYHALSVSGLHLAVVALVGFVALTWLFAALEPVAARIAPRRLAAAIALPLAIGYTLVTGGQVATLRALVAVIAVLGGELVERRMRAADALGLAALVLLALRPSVLFDPGFELSFVAATTLVLAARGARRLALPAARARRMAHGVRRAVATSWAVTLATAPITAHHFGQVSLGGVVGNLVAGPAIELAAIPLGLVGLGLAALWPAAGGLVLDLAVLIAGLTARVIAAIAAWTPSLLVRAPTTIELVACAALYAAWAWPRVVATRWAPRGLAVVAALVLCGSWAWHAHDRGDALRVTFLDVGQGDAAVIELPDGAVWLVDAGGAPGGATVGAQIAPGRAVASFLRARGITRVDVAVVSHPHPDHYLGLLAVADEVAIDELWAARVIDEPPDHERLGGGLRYDDVVAHLRATGTQVVHPELGVHQRGDVTVEVLGPRFVGADGGAADPIATADPVRSVNDDSLVIRFGRAGRCVLFTGDLELEGEDALAAGGALACDVVKVPHHGSPTSSSDALVDATAPAWAVMSLGRGNRFGFPGPAVVARWQRVGAEVLRTDVDGAVTVTIDRRGGISVDTFD